MKIATKIAGVAFEPQMLSAVIDDSTGRIAYSVYNLGERIPFERLVTTLNQLWANALKLDQR